LGAILERHIFTNGRKGLLQADKNEFVSRQNENTMVTNGNLVERFRNNVAIGGVMCSGVRSIRVLKTFLPKLFYFRYLNPLTL